MRFAWIQSKASVGLYWMPGRRSGGVSDRNPACFIFAERFRENSADDTGWFSASM